MAAISVVCSELLSGSQLQMATRTSVGLEAIGVKGLPLNICGQIRLPMTLISNQGKGKPGYTGMDRTPLHSLLLEPLFLLLNIAFPPYAAAGSSKRAPFPHLHVLPQLSTNSIIRSICVQQKGLSNSG